MTLLDTSTNRLLQQSHHCGIETVSVLLTVRQARKGSNRTIVGLKLYRYAQQYGGVYTQQSHHCGIETVSA